METAWCVELKTTLRKDITLVPESTKTIIILKFTVPWEDCLEEEYKRKRAKYEGLVIACWKAAGVFLGNPSTEPKAHCINGAKRRRDISNTIKADEKASRWI